MNKSPITAIGGCVTCLTIGYLAGKAQLRPARKAAESITDC